jgi:hypothetical protein
MKSCQKSFFCSNKEKENLKKIILIGATLANKRQHNLLKILLGPNSMKHFTQKQPFFKVKMDVTATVVVLALVTLGDTTQITENLRPTVLVCYSISPTF